jgi:type II secretory pathway pseudopilin PulG
MSQMRADSGFTLVETLVAMVAAVVVFGATLSVLEVFQVQNGFAQQRNETQDNVRTMIDSLSRELRNVAAPGPTTAGALELAKRYSIVFQEIEPNTTGGKGKNLTNATRVRYCLNDVNDDNEQIYRQVKRWESAEAPPLPTETKCPDKQAGDYETETLLAEHVVNRIGGQTRPLFKYIPAGSSVGVSEITTVEPDVYIDVNPGHRPGESELRSSIALRNENRPPVASFTWKELGSRVIQLNGSQSTDPDGLALTYKWWDNGVRLTSTSPETETKPLEKGSTHEFKLEVTTPGNLSNSVTETVVVT